MENTEADLQLCNLVSQGMSLSEARKHLVKQLSEVSEEGEKTETKLSASDRKEILKSEIIALGGEPPADNSSVAKFQETLDGLKEKLDEKPEGEDTKDLL
jgi:hypothetical protein